jgi:transcriptional regulator NrdR family protein
MDPLNCPACGSANIRRSQRRNVFENALRGLRMRPWRCQDCQARFFRFRRRQPNRPAKEKRPHQRWWWERLPASTKIQIAAYAIGAVLILALLSWLVSGAGGD